MWKLFCGHLLLLRDDPLLVLLWRWHWIFLRGFHDCWLCPLVTARYCRLIRLLIHHVACRRYHNTAIGKHLADKHGVKVSLLLLALRRLQCRRRLCRIWGCPALRIRNYILIEQITLDKSIWRARCHKVLIVDLTSTCWVNSYKVIFADLFLEWLSNYISISAINLRYAFK